MSNCQIIADYLLTLPVERGGSNKTTWEQVSKYAARGFYPVDDQTHPSGDVRNGPSVIDVPEWYVELQPGQGLERLDGVTLWVDNSAEVENYQSVYHELADPTKAVPQAYLDASGDPPNTRWETWGVLGASYAPVEIDGKWYRSTLYDIGGGASTGILPGSAWAQYVGQPGTQQTGIERMLTLAEYLEIVAAASAEPAAQTTGRKKPKDC